MSTINSGVESSFYTDVCLCF